MTRQGIAIAGSILVDRLYEISDYPEKGELTKIKSISRAVGGCVPNVAIDIKKVKDDIPVYALGKTGKDEEGAFVLSELSQNGVITSDIKQSTTKTSFTDVMTIPEGQRTFFTYPGASCEFGFEDIDFNTLNVKMLHLGYFLLLDKIDNGDGIRILREAQRRGIITSIDLVSENSNRYSIVLPCLKYTDNLIINETEAGMITGIKPSNENLKEIAERLMTLGVKKRVIIHKPDISICLSENGFTAVPSFDLPKGYIKGTTGAGDAFCAGALIKIYEEKDDTEILEFASGTAVASLSATDATGGITDEKEIENLKNILNRKKICL